MLGVAVKVTVCPAQIVALFDAILTVGVTGAVVVMVIAFETTVVKFKQLALDVNWQVTISLLLKLLAIKVLLFVPALLPFTFHW